MTATHGEGTYGNAVGVTTPVEHKMAQVTEFVKTTTKNIIRPGVLYNGDASLVDGTAGMSYDVDAFSIVTQRSATSGVVKWANDGTLNVATTAAPGSNSRYDVVYAWHREYALDGVDSNPVIGVVQGTAAASPTVPSLSAFPGAVELARILVPSGVTATNSGTTFTQTAPFTAVDGGTVIFRTSTEINAWTTALTGQLAFDLATSITYRYNSSAWVRWSMPRTAFTPTVGGFTSATTGPTLTGWWAISGGLASGLVTGKLGTGTITVGTITVTLPFTVNTTGWLLGASGSGIPGTVTYFNDGVQEYAGVAILQNSTTALMKRFSAADGSINLVSSTAPFTWGTLDEFSFAFAGLPVA